MLLLKLTGIMVYNKQLFNVQLTALADKINSAISVTDDSQEYIPYILDNYIDRQLQYNQTAKKIDRYRQIDSSKIDRQITPSWRWKFKKMYKEFCQFWLNLLLIMTKKTFFGHFQKQNIFLLAYPLKLAKIIESTI